MTIQRTDLLKLEAIFESIKNLSFNIETQYKFLVLRKKIKEEINYANEQISILIENYGEKDENNNLKTTDDGGVKIQTQYLAECQKKIDDINNLSITLPDLFFSLDELEPLKLSFNQLEALEPFIKI